MLPTYRVSFNIEDILDWRWSATSVRQEIIERAYQCLPDEFDGDCQSYVSVDGQHIDIDVVFVKEA